MVQMQAMRSSADSVVSDPDKFQTQQIAVNQVKHATMLCQRQALPLACAGVAATRPAEQPPGPAPPGGRHWRQKSDHADQVCFQSCSLSDPAC